MPSKPVDKGGRFLSFRVRRETKRRVVEELTKSDKKDFVLPVGHQENAEIAPKTLETGASKEAGGLL
jgi:hypothetical protein